MLNKDFYNRLPGFVCEILDGFIEKYSEELWFEQAWNEYRDYVLSVEDIFDLKMPGYIFNKYVKAEEE